MKDGKITVASVNQMIVTLARYTPMRTTLIVKQNGTIIETVSVLKQQETDLIGTTPTVPRVAPTVPLY